MQHLGVDDIIDEFLFENPQYKDRERTLKIISEGLFVINNSLGRGFDVELFLNAKGLSRIHFFKYDNNYTKMKAKVLNQVEQAEKELNDVSTII